ncbi:MAG TPA: hypothetical protein VH916_00980 [Dehalococcoidia bacterium]
MRRLLSLLLLLDLLAIVGFVRPLRFSSHFPGPTYALFDIIGHTYGATWRYTALVAALVALFLAAHALASGMRGPHLTYIVFGGAALLSLTYLLLYPATSSDLFHYVMEGRILWVHHENPFTQPPSFYPNDPFYSVNGYLLVVWETLPSPYGPLWAVLTGVPLLLGHGDMLHTYMAFKLLAVAFYFLGAVAIFHTVRFLRPGKEWGATLLFTWNPLVLMYVAGNGANDVIMMGLTLLALYLGVRGRWNTAFPVLALATLVKFVSAVLIPVFVVYAVLTTPRERWRGLVLPLGLSAVIGLLLYAPFWRGQLTFTTLRYQASQFTDSPGALLKTALANVLVIDDAIIVTKVIFFSALTVAYTLVLWSMIKRRTRLTPDDLPSASFAVVCAYLMLAVFWFQPWYLLWLISLGALTVGMRQRVTLLFSFTGLLTHTATSIAAIEGWYYFSPLQPGHPLLEIGAVLVLVFLAPGLYICGALLVRTRRGHALVARLPWVGARPRTPAVGSPGGAPASGD